MEKQPTYGAGRHYQGQLGVEYYEWQGRHAEAGALLNQRKFAPYIKSSDIVMDFGCGGGALLARLQCGQRLGVEVNPASRAATQDRGIECVADLAQVPDHFADVAITNHTLEHIPHPVQALRELSQKVRSGGKIVICVPIDDWRTQKRFHVNDRNHHLHTWTPLLLGNTIAEANLSVDPLDIRILAHAWPPFYGHLSKLLPKQGFDVLATSWAIVRKQRQLLAVVHI